MKFKILVVLGLALLFAFPAHAWKSEDSGDATTIQGVPIDAPEAGDDNKLIFYDHDNLKYDYIAAAGVGDLLADGTVPLTADWDVGAYDIAARSFTGDGGTKFTCNALVGGAAGALDDLLVATLAEGDRAEVSTISGATVITYSYVFDASATTAELSPYAIRPDDYSSAGVWFLAQKYVSQLHVNSGTPKVNFYEANAPDSTDTIMGYIEYTYVNGADDAENADILVYAHQQGTSTLVFTFDESDDQWETTKTIDAAGLEISGTSVYYPGGTDVADADVVDTLTLTNISQITTKPITALSATNWRIFYSADGAVPVELALGADGTYLMSNGAAVAPSFETPGGTGDVTGVGDCADGACLDGTSDGGETISLYDGDSHKGTIDVPDLSGDVTYTLPAATSTLLAADGVGTALTALNGENIQDNTIDVDSLDWEAFTDLGESGAVIWGNLSEGELTDSSIITADIKDGEIVNVDISASAAIDQSKISGFGGSADPNLLLRDTDAEGADDADEEAGRFYANLITTTEDDEDSDIWVTAMQDGSPLTVWRFDESDNQLEMKTPVQFEAAVTSTSQAISDNSVVTVDAADVADDEYARFTANGLESRTAVEVLSDIKNADADIWQAVAVSVAGMIADGTNCSDPDSEAINSGPNVWFSTCSDAAGTLEFGIPMPENWDGGNIYVEMLAGSMEGSPSGTVEFEVSTMARGNDDLINNTWVTGDNVQFASNIDTQYDLVIAESDVIAASGAGGDLLIIKLTRDSDDGTNDTSTQDVEVWGARVYYQIDDLDERD